MPLTADDIRRAFAALSAELPAESTRAEIVVVGGAALVLLFGTRASTKDVDAYFVAPAASTLRASAAAVASRLNLPDDWLNDGAKGYMVGLTTGDTLFETPQLVVRSASIPQLLAMKLAAWRDAIDRDDARTLLTSLNGSREEIFASILPFIPAHNLDKASYAFDDLWESVYGHP